MSHSLSLASPAPPARSDSAGERFLTGPGLLVFLFTALAAYQAFLLVTIFGPTQGGPLGATRTLVLYMYEEGFRWWRMGTSSAVAVLLLLVTLVGTLAQMRAAKRSEV